MSRQANVVFGKYRRCSFARERGFSIFIFRCDSRADNAGAGGICNVARDSGGSVLASTRWEKTKARDNQ